MKIFVKTMTFILIMTMLLPVTAYATAPENENAYQDEREQKISDLFDERQEILSNKPVSIQELNVIDLELHNLGVDFLSESEVVEEFPEAKTAIEGETGELNIANTNSSVSTRTVVVPDSDVNTWASYRSSNYLYNGTYYNIQRLIVQPLVEDGSPLWDEGAKTVNYSVDWTAGVTTFLKQIAYVGASQLAPVTATVYDVLSSVWSSLQPVSDIDPADVIYRWENRTTAVFSYVRLESQTDYDQRLVLIATKCQTSVAYIVDIDSWSQNGDGTLSPVPAQITGTKMLYSTPANYNSISRACYAYNNWAAGPVYDRITSISISGPESKYVVTIYPCCPEFPNAAEP